VRTASVAFGLSLACGVIFTPYAIRLARRLKAIDHAGSSRKVHKQPIPRLGGIAIVGAFFVPIVGLLLVDSAVGRMFYGDGLRPLALFLGGGLIAALGVYDDLKGANAKVKFAVQFAVAALVYALGYRIDSIANPFGDPIALGALGLPFTMLWVAGVINALNLVDGLDGLAGGTALLAVATTFVFAVLHGEPLIMLFTAALAGALVGFLRWNLNPAKIFMGDTGSMFLGFVLSTSAITAHEGSHTRVAMLVPIVVLAFPITDTLLAMARRWARGAPLFAADRGHIHHRLLDLGLSHRQTVLVLHGVCAVLGAAAILLAHATPAQAALLLASLAAASGLALRRLGFLRVEHTAQVLELRRANLARREALRRVGQRLQVADEMGHVWATLKDAGPALGAHGLALRLEERCARGRRRTHHFVHGLDEAADLLRTEHSVRGERGEASGPATLELGWRGAALDRDTELAVEQLCGSLQSALQRIGPIGPEAVADAPAHEPAPAREARKANGVG
jgi:UDP-GlcNAc:undecaprenyl-phosphate GlcNAc-1-phosphate transferase